LCRLFSVIIIGVFDIGIEGIGKMAIQNDVGDFLVYRFTDSSISTLIEQIDPVTEAASFVKFSTNVGMAIKLGSTVITEC